MCTPEYEGVWMGVGMARERVTDCTACSRGVSRGEQCWGQGRGNSAKGGKGLSASEPGPEPV